MNDQGPRTYRPAEIRSLDGHVPQRCTAGALLTRQGKLLLERRPDDARVYAGVWDFPGGHVEHGETPELALLREMEEELSIVPRRFFLAAVQDDLEPASGIFYRHFVYIVESWDGEMVQHEGRVIRWVRYEEALRLERLNPLAGSALRDVLDKGWLPG